MSDRTLVIAGPGEHFAEALARRYAAEGFEIALLGRNQDRLDSLTARLGGCGNEVTSVLVDFTADHKVRDAVSQCAAQMPPWGCIAYHVKQSHHGDALGADPEAILADFDSNVLGAIRLARAAITGWRRTEEASVLLAGGGYKDAPDSHKLSLSLSKAALHTLTLAMQETASIYMSAK